MPGPDQFRNGDDPLPLGQAPDGYLQGERDGFPGGSQLAFPGEFIIKKKILTGY
jgi:hypothetical protein